MWNLWVVKGVVRKRERRKLGCLVESRTDARAAEGLSGLLLSQRAVCAYDIALVSLEQEPSQLVPMCCHFWGFPST